VGKTPVRLTGFLPLALVTSTVVSNESNTILVILNLLMLRSLI